MLEIHQESHILAVGVPCMSQEASSSSVAQSRGNEEVIAIYNLHSGHKKQSLCLGNVFHQLASQWTSQVIHFEHKYFRFDADAAKVLYWSSFRS